MKKFAALILSAVLSVSGCLTSTFAENINNTASETKTGFSNDVNLAAEEKIPAFPGAEGGGKYATGGRGGKIYHVTNLNDSGPGSFRDAVSGSNRIVVFDVGGTIELKSDVVVKGNITIAGQTAPGGGGITLKNYKLGMGGDNIIVRFLSSRPGPGGKENDYDGWGGSHGSISMIDHCATGWATDEQLALYSHNMYQTVQWSVIGPSNSWGGHPKGAHGFGIMFGRGQNSWHHNMIAHNISRNYRGKVPGTYVMDYVNNVIYDWGYQTAYGTHGHVNYVNNYFKAGNSTTGGYRYFTIDGSDRHKYRFYLTGNKILNKDGSIRNDVNNNWADDVIDYSSTLNNDAVLDSNGNKLQKGYCKVDERMPLYDYGTITTYVDQKKTYNQYNPDSKKEDLSVLASGKIDTADEAYEKVLAYAGTGISADKRTPIDKQVMEEAKNGTGSLSGTSSYESANSTVKATIDKNKIQCSTVYEYPPQYLTKEIIDSDNDGMPDEWELERGLNPNSASDMNGDYCGLGYTNIEYYLNDLTVNAFPEGVVTLSPTIKNSVVVDPSVSEVEGESYKTIASAVAYMKANEAEMTKGRKTIFVAPGTYDENITVEQSELSIMPLEGKTGEISISGLNISSSADNFSASGVSLGNCNVSADKTTFDGCKFLNTSTSVAVDNKARAYFKNCTMNGTAAADSRVVFNKCTIQSDDFIAKSTREAGDSYGILILNSKITGTGDTLLSDITDENGQVVYYKCEMSNIAAKSSDTGSTEKIRISACETGGIEPAYSMSLSEYDYNERFTPFIHLKAKYGEKADNWNPDGFDEVTPQEKLKELADSISVQDTIILRNTKLDTSFNTDLDVKAEWTSSDSSILKDNTIIVGEYGSGVKYAKLTVTLSVDGYKPEVREFNVIVGSLSENSESIVDFEDEELGKESNYLKMTTAYTQNDKIKWGVTNNIDGMEYADKGKFFQVKQSQKTNADAAVDPGKGIYDFTFNFGEQKDKVIEVSFDLCTGAIDGYVEAYLRGGDSLGQLRITSSEVLANTNSKNRETLANDTDEWLKLKMVVDTRGVSDGTAPKIDYYLLDDEGNIKKSILNAGPAKDYTLANASRFIPNKLQFRPDRTNDLCEFYVDNICFRDLTEIAEKDASEFKDNYVMNEGDRLPAYGSRLSNITWSVIDGQGDVVESDGTINYANCGVTAIKVKGIASCGDNIKGTAETGEITLIVNGTGQNTEVESDKYFNDTEDFSKWYKEILPAAGNHNIDTANKETVQGNSTVKMKLPDKAVFKKFKTPATSGKVTFTTDFLQDNATSGRTFRIFFETAETEDDGNGYGKTTFNNDNIFYHMTDIGGTTYVVTSDSPSANDKNPYEGKAVGKLEANKWYRIQVDLDFNNKTAVTKIYPYIDGNYAPDNISGTPLGEVTSNLISKNPLSLKQIRLVRTAGTTVYFDNVSVAAERNVTGVSIVPTEAEMKVGDTYQLNAVVSPSDALDKSVSWTSSASNIASVDEKGLVTAKADGNAVITVKTTEGGFSANCNITVKSGEIQIPLGDVDGNGAIEVRDAVLTLQYVLNKEDADIKEEYIGRMKVTDGEEITATDAAYILNKALNSVK